jgi:hypothetical protein
MTRLQLADRSLPFYCGSSSPDCSRTMYSAYQSGQLGSAFPIRALCFPCAVVARIIASERSCTEHMLCRLRYAQEIAL